MSELKGICVCCGRKTPYQELTPVVLSGHHAENLNAGLCGACLLDLDGAKFRNAPHPCVPDFHVRVGKREYYVQRR